MKCPWCGNEMEKGLMQAKDEIFYSEKEHCFWASATGKKEIVLAKEPYGIARADAYHCKKCGKIVVDYAESTSD